jgi:hypothetical protein
MNMPSPEEHGRGAVLLDFLDTSRVSDKICDVLRSEKGDVAFFAIMTVLVSIAQETGVMSKEMFLAIMSEAWECGKLVDRSEKAGMN